MKLFPSIVMIGAGLLLAQGCAAQPTTSAQPPAAIESFTYSFGSLFGSTSEYTLDRTGGQTHFTAKKTDWVESDTLFKVNRVVDDAVWNDLELIVAAHDLNSWDGHDESEYGVTDGYSFSLDYARADGSTLTAHEYGSEIQLPSYYAAHEDLTKLFDALVEKSSALSAPHDIEDERRPFEAHGRHRSRQEAAQAPLELAEFGV